MRTTIIAMSLILMTAGCGKSSDPVGENSAGSIKTTAVGEIVGTVPGSTPTPVADDAAAVTQTADNAMAENETE